MLFPISKNIHLIRKHVNTDIDGCIIDDMQDLSIFIDRAIVDAIYTERIVLNAFFIAERKDGVYVISIQGDKRIVRVFRKKRELTSDIRQIEGRKPSVQRVRVMNAKTNDVIGQSSSGLLRNQWKGQ